jgi:hypothetical protein
MSSYKCSKISFVELFCLEYLSKMLKTLMYENYSSLQYLMKVLLSQLQVTYG